MTKGFEVLIHVETTIPLRYEVMHICCCPHASLTLALCTQGMGSQKHGTHSLPAAAVSSRRSRASALVDLVITPAPQWSADRARPIAHETRAARSTARTCRFTWHTRFPGNASEHRPMHPDAKRHIEQHHE